MSAGIVLYNPDIQRLELNLDSITPQVKEVFLIDNASTNKMQIRRLVEKYSNCVLIENKKNVGIAKALNQLMEKAEKKNYGWMLTLDDDSVCDRDLIKKLSLCINDKRYGIICASAVDDKIGKTNLLSEKYSKIEQCITAGALTNVNAWKTIGKFDDKLFIDFVDIEYCTRLRLAGYEIIRDNTTYVHQQYGNINGSFHIFGKTFYRYNYSPVRIYYSVRNMIYYIKKYNKRIPIVKWKMYFVGYIGKHILLENNRMKTIAAIKRGIRDGRTM